MTRPRHVSDYIKRHQTAPASQDFVPSEPEDAPVIRFPTPESWYEYRREQYQKGNEIPPGYCKYGCGGTGYFRRDYPVGHKLFGRAKPCQCKVEEKLTAQVEQGRQDLAPSEQKYDWSTWTGTDKDALKRVKVFAAQKWGIGCLWSTTKGVGKTGLLATVANVMLAEGIPVRFLTVTKFLDELRACYDKDKKELRENFDDVFEYFCTVKVLLLDEWGKEKASDWAWEKFFALMDERFRYYDRRLTLLATNEAPDYHNAVWSRLSEGAVIQVKGNDVRPFQPNRAPDFRNYREDE